MSVCWVETHYRIPGRDELIWIIGISEDCREMDWGCDVGHLIAGIVCMQRFGGRAGVVRGHFA